MVKNNLWIELGDKFHKPEYDKEKEQYYVTVIFPKTAEYQEIDFYFKTNFNAQSFYDYLCILSKEKLRL